MTAKLSDQNSIKVVPATLDRWMAIQELFSETPCWCQYWRVSASEYGRISKGDLQRQMAKRRTALRDQLKRSTPPGVMAYIDNEVVGWCGFGPRHAMERLVRSRTIPNVDDSPVWSIVCFLVRSGYRRRGVARALLDGAIECARSYEVPVLEAYPIDPGGKRINTAASYVGTASMFEKAGFHRVIETSAHSAGLTRWLMRLELNTGAKK